MKDALLKFLSRKFLIAAGAIIPLVSAKRYYEAAGVAAAYIAAEAHVDKHRAYAAASQVLQGFEETEAEDGSPAIGFAAPPQHEEPEAPAAEVPFFKVGFAGPRIHTTGGN